MSWKGTNIGQMTNPMLQKFITPVMQKIILTICSDDHEQLWEALGVFPTE